MCSIGAKDKTNIKSKQHIKLSIKVATKRIKNMQNYKESKRETNIQNNREMNREMNTQMNREKNRENYK